jgi:hypothetical protein
MTHQLARRMQPFVLRTYSEYTQIHSNPAMICQAFLLIFNQTLPKLIVLLHECTFIDSAMNPA